MPTNLGDWPLTIVVMVFTFSMFQLSVRGIKIARDDYSADLAAQRAEHQKTMDAQRNQFLETWGTHMQSMAQELTRLAIITDTMEKTLAKFIQTPERQSRPRRR